MRLASYLSFFAALITTDVPLAPIGGKRGGLGGKASLMPAPPQGYTARIDLWDRPSWRGPVIHAESSPREGSDSKCDESH